MKLSKRRAAAVEWVLGVFSVAACGDTVADSVDWLNDGECDSLFDCEATGYDAGDCAP